MLICLHICIGSVNPDCRAHTPWYQYHGQTNIAKYNTLPTGAQMGRSRLVLEGVVLEGIAIHWNVLRTKEGNSVGRYLPPTCSEANPLPSLPPVLVSISLFTLTKHEILFFLLLTKHTPPPPHTALIIYRFKTPRNIYTKYYFILYQAIIIYWDKRMFKISLPG